MRTPLHRRMTDGANWTLAPGLALAVALAAAAPFLSPVALLAAVSPLAVIALALAAQRHLAGVHLEEELRRFEEPPPAWTVRSMATWSMRIVVHR